MLARTRFVLVSLLLSILWPQQASAEVECERSDAWGSTCSVWADPGPSEQAPGDGSSGGTSTASERVCSHGSRDLPCKTYAGTCLKTGTSADGISYTFTPFQTPDISGTFLTSASQINPYRGITDTWQIANLTQTSCELKVIASGTCTPIIMRLVLSFD